MFVSLLHPNMRNDRARNDLQRPYDLHRTLITRVFGGNNDNVPRGKAPETMQKADVLFRIEHEPIPIVLVQSHMRPDWSLLEEWHDVHDRPYLRRPAQCKEITWELVAGQRLSFRLCASPTKRAGNRFQGHEKIQVGDRIALYGEEEQLAWLARKFTGRALPDGRVENDGGFRLLRATTSREMRHTQRIHDDKHDLSFLRVQFDGILEVVDPKLAIETVKCGIGTAKSMGCGLLSLAPVPVFTASRSM